MNEQHAVLVVDNRWSMRQSVAAALRDMGCTKILLACDGLEAQHLLQTESVAVVIADWSVSGVNGLSLLRWVRGQARYADLPFVLVTAQSERAQVTAALDAGASACLVRPYTVRDLANKIGRVLDLACLKRALGAAAGDRVLGLANAGEEQENAERATVLIVDDVPLNVAMIGSILRSEYATVSAASGRVALEIAQSGLPPDIILLDVMMPEMDGYEVCRRLKAEAATRDIPVIFLTSHDEAREIVRGLETGAVDYIAKPVEASILRARLRTHLRLKSAFCDLAQQNSALSVAAKLREDLERIVSHDLYIPISAIIAAAHTLLADGALSQKNAQLTHMIEDQARRAFDVANDALGSIRMDTDAAMPRKPPQHGSGTRQEAR